MPKANKVATWSHKITQRVTLSTTRWVVLPETACLLGRLFAIASALLAHSRDTSTTRLHLLRTYAQGGLTCCAHKRIMLDEDQVVPEELLRYHMKFRFWYQVMLDACMHG